MGATLVSTDDMDRRARVEQMNVDRRRLLEDMALICVTERQLLIVRQLIHDMFENIDRLVQNE